MEPKDQPNPFGKWTIIGGNFPPEWKDDPEMARIMQALLEASIIAAQREEALERLMGVQQDPDPELDDAITDIILDDVQEYPEALCWIMGAYRKGEELGWKR